MEIDSEKCPLDRVSSGSSPTKVYVDDVDESTLGIENIDETATDMFDDIFGADLFEEVIKLN